MVQSASFFSDEEKRTDSRKAAEAGDVSLSKTKRMLALSI